jgi:hypothetical protein
MSSSHPILAVPAAAALARLRAESPSALFPGARDPACCAASVFLRHGDWRAAHAIVEKLETADAAYLHMVAHRTEPDAWNAKWWCGQLPRDYVIYAALSDAAAAALKRTGVARAVPRPWDAAAFVDWCEEATKEPQSPLAAAVADIRAVEADLLFEHLKK